jgi:dephospho-CoA kinase
MATTSPVASSRSDRPGFAVGLTGGIGSGKSAVADLFAELGAAIVDTDAIAHALTAPGGAAIDPIAREFGADVIAPDGALDRSRMRALVFADASARARLESILHPRIRALAEAQTAAALDHAPYVIQVVPLLVESGNWRGRVDRLLVIDCTQAAQVARVRSRSGLAEPMVRSIIAQQASRAERLAAADDVLVNDGALEDLVPRVGRLHRRYCELAHERRHRL